MLAKRCIRLFPGVLACGIGMWNAPRALAGGVLFWQQDHDFVNALSSEIGTAVPGSNTADDFFFSGAFLTNVTVFMVASFPNQPLTYVVDLYRDGGGRPGTLVTTFHNPAIIDRGVWNAMPEWHLFEVSFDTGLLPLPGELFWLSAYGIGNGSMQDRARWGTASTGDPIMSQGMFRSAGQGFPDWTGVSHPDLLGVPSDFAFHLSHLLPSPGVLPLLALGLLTHPRRRRWLTA